MSNMLKRETDLEFRLFLCGSDGLDHLPENASGLDPSGLGIKSKAL